MALALNNLKRVDMPLNKQKKKQTKSYLKNVDLIFCRFFHLLFSFLLKNIYPVGRGWGWAVEYTDNIFVMGYDLPTSVLDMTKYPMVRFQ